MREFWYGLSKFVLFFGGALAVAYVVTEIVFPITVPRPQLVQEEAEPCHSPKEVIKGVWDSLETAPLDHLKGEDAQWFVEQTGGVGAPLTLGQVTDVLIFPQLFDANLRVVVAFADGCQIGAKFLPAEIVSKSKRLRGA
jgi:hypothetical protein